MTTNYERLNSLEIVKDDKEKLHKEFTKITMDLIYEIENIKNKKDKAKHVYKTLNFVTIASKKYPSFINENKKFYNTMVNKFDEIIRIETPVELS
jgi:hypothetical protein